MNTINSKHVKPFNYESLTLSHYKKIECPSNKNVIGLIRYVYIDDNNHQHVKTKITCEHCKKFF